MNYPNEESDLNVYIDRLATLRERREAYAQCPSDATYLDMWAAENDKERAWEIIERKRRDHAARKCNFEVTHCIDLTLGALD